MSLISILWFGIGAGLGSVANALIYRLPRGVSWWRGRSICPKCKHKLSWVELVPIVSYIMLKAKCLKCKKPISIRYFLVELGMGLAFMVIQSQWLALIVFVTMIIAVIDWETQLVSEGLVAIWAILVVVSGQGDVWGLVVGVGVIGGIWAVTRGRGMGFGDVEIAAVAGWWLGWPKVIPALWIAFVGGAIVGVMKVMGRKATMKSRMAFGTFLIMGAWMAYFWGDTMLKWILFRS